MNLLKPIEDPSSYRLNLLREKELYNPISFIHPHLVQLSNIRNFEIVNARLHSKPTGWYKLSINPGGYESYIKLPDVFINPIEKSLNSELGGFVIYDANLPKSYSFFVAYSVNGIDRAFITILTKNGEK